MKEKNIHHYYENLAQEYDENRFSNSYGKYIHHQELTFLKKHLDSQETVSLACGTGRFMEFAQIGIDFSEAMVKQAGSKFSDKRFICADAENTTLETGKTANIFCFHLLMHLPKEKAEAIFNECFRITKSGGKLIFDVPSSKRRRLFYRKQNDWHADTSYSIYELKQLLSKNWTIKRISGTLFFPIHRIPVGLRPLFRPIDSLLCRSFLKEYSSHLIVLLEKK